MTLPIGLQLYTVRDALAQDFERSLKQVAKFGYEYVEWAGLYGRTAAQVRTLADKLGLKSSSAHAGLEAFTTGLDQTIADARTLGYTLLVCPWLDGKYHNPEGFKHVAKVLTEAGKKAADHGMKVCYHNHAFEFNKLADGSIGMDILYGESDPRFVWAELDLYWVWHGGQCPNAWLQKLAGRTPLVHVKDMAKLPDRRMIEVGHGILDMATYLRTAEATGTQFLVVEQDGYWVDNDPLLSAKISYKNLGKILAGKKVSQPKVQAAAVVGP